MMMMKNKEVWECVDHVGQAHEEVVGPAADIPCQHADRGSQQEDDDRGKKTHNDGNARSIDGAA
jgi:hypothetical protein